MGRCCNNFFVSDFFGSAIWWLCIQFEFVSRWQWSTNSSASQHLSTIPQHFLLFRFSTLQLLIHFHKPIIFLDVVDLKLPSRLNASFQLFKRTCFCFSKSQTTNRYTNQPTSRVQFPSLFHFCINKLLHTIIILDYIMLTGLILTNMQISHQYKLSTQSQSRKVTHWVTLYW